MRIQIIDDRIGTATNTQITAQVRGADNVLVPGVLAWAAVATKTLQGVTVTISAEITTEEVVSTGDYAGTPVTQEFISEYIVGAGEWWLGTDGSMFVASSVAFPQPLSLQQDETPAETPAPAEEPGDPA